MGILPPLRAVRPGRRRLRWTPARRGLPPPPAVALLLELPPVYRVEAVLVHHVAPRRPLRLPLRPLPGERAALRSTIMLPGPARFGELPLLPVPEEQEEGEARHREAAQRRAHHGHGDVAPLPRQRRRRRRRGGRRRAGGRRRRGDRRRRGEGRRPGGREPRLDVLPLRRGERGDADEEEEEEE